MRPLLPKAASASPGGRFEGGYELGLIADDPHASAPATGGSLDDHRIPDGFSDRDGLFLLLDLTGASGEDRRTGFLGHGAAGDLVTKQGHRLWTGPDEGDLTVLAHFREVGVLGEEGVPGMNGVGVSRLGGRDDSIDAEIGIRCGTRSDADALVSLLEPWSILVGFGIDADGLYAQLVPGCPDDSKGDLATIGYEEGVG